MQLLKQSTAITAKIGPFLDDGDGKTAETELSIVQADVRLSKNGANFGQKNDVNSCAHDAAGYYNCSLNATDIGTLGRLLLAVHKPGALPVWHEYMVVPANVYESLFGSDKLQVHTAEITDDLITASTIATDALTSSEVADSALNEIADTILKRGVSNVEDAADIHSLAAVILATLEFEFSGTTWTIKKTGGTTFDTKTVSVDVDANPIIGVT